MAERSGIYNKSGQYMDIDLAIWNSLLKHDIGVVLGVGDELKVNAGTGLEVKVGAGGCWLGEPCGWWYYNNARKSLILDAEVEGYKRADRIVVRHDRNADALESVVVVKRGVPATVDPQPPVLQQDSVVFELPLAIVTMTGGTYEIELVDDRGLEYTEGMAQFFAMSGGPGTVRIKVELPLSGEADGVLIHESTTPYDGTGLNWGNPVATLTDDTGYKEANNWYVVQTNISNGARCYYKGFVYKGEVYNIKASVNETSAIVGKLYNEFTMDTESVSGSTVINTAAGADLTAYNISFATGKVGQAAYFNGSSGRMLGHIFNGSQIDSNFTIEMWLKRENSGSVAHFNNHRIAGIRNGGQNLRLRDTGGTDHSLNGTIDYNQWHHVVFVRSLTRGMIMYVDKQIVDTDSFKGGVKSATSASYNAIGYDNVAQTDYFKGWICQLRFYITDLYDEDVEVLNNGGTGC